MVKLVYIDETGSVGKGANKQELLTLAAVLVPEDEVQSLAESVREVARAHIGFVPEGFELHGNEIWGRKSHWSGKTYDELIAAYADAAMILKDLSLEVSWASIHKKRLHDKYNGSADGNAYLLALQFLLEKIDKGYTQRKILIADEHKEHQLRAIKMVSNMQEWGFGEVPGKPLRNIIDSIHFVSSNSSPGVQMADIVAFAIQRKWSGRDTHPNAAAGISRIFDIVQHQAGTWRQPWPPSP